MPDWGAEIGRRLAHLGFASAREAEIVEELSQHLDDRFEELRLQGVPERVASDVALAELLDTEALARGLRGIERARGLQPIPAGVITSGGFVDNLRQDFRFALRVLRKSPAFTAIAVFTLALGVGATTAIFSVVNAVLLRPLPYPEPERLAVFWLTAPEKGLPEVALPDGLFHHYRAQSKTFQHLAAYTGQGFTLTGAGDPERLRGANVTLDFFRVLGKQPVLGRTFRAEEATRGNNLVVIVSHAAWQRRFGGDPGIIGRTIILDDIPMVVVGIMPAGFEFPSRSELWIPLALNPESLNAWYLSAIGRLAAGRSADDARREIETLTDEFALRRPERFPDAKRGGTRAIAMPLATLVAGDVRTPLLVLLGSVVLVLLIVCANIANLLLARAAARSREMALRCCIGASPRRIAAQLATESLVLAIAGAGGGLVLAYWTVGLLRRLTAAQLPRIDEVHLDLMVLAFAIIVALASGMLFGLVPALRGARVDLQSALKDGPRGTVTGANRRLRHAFVVSQLALSLVLLIGAGLLLRSFQRLLAIDPGFRAENTLVARVELPYPKYDNDAVVRRFYARLIESVRTVPAVRAAGLNENVPFSPGNQQNEVIAEGREPRPGEPIPVASVRAVTPGYFAAIGTPILAGRGILDSDTETMPLVAVIDESLARRFWPKGDAIGKRIRKGVDPATNPWLTVVGIARSVKHTSLDEVGDLQLYEPFAQNPRWGSFLVVRAAGAPEGLTAALRARLAGLDPTLPLFDVHTMEQALDRSLGTKRLTNALLGGFALIALLLAAIGIYGVMSLHVSARMKEFGIRLALGARPAAVLGLVMREGLTLAVAGVVLGLVGASLLTRLLGGLLYGVRPLDALTFGGVAAILATVALVACWVPARRATKADPLIALRAE